MDFKTLESRIIELCQTYDNFQKRIDQLQTELEPWDRNKLRTHLFNGGVIPESFDHDSSEEKLYAKYCDILLEAFFRLFGMKTELIKERGDRADVIAINNKYTIVGDAKSFRLSRTALNPKDFKLAALNTWRNNDNAEYACLIGPYHDFPGERSRLYSEAVNNNVLLISYTHIYYILDSKNWKETDLKSIWEMHEDKELFDKKITGKVYWDSLEETISSLITPSQSFSDVVQLWNSNLVKIGSLQIKYLELTKKEFSNWNKVRLLKKVISLSRIDSKIHVIRKKLPEEL